MTIQLWSSLRWIRLKKKTNISLNFIYIIWKKNILHLSHHNLTFLPRKRWATFIHVIICNVKWRPEFDFLLNSGTCQTIKHWIESDLIYNWTMSFQNKIGPFDWFRRLIYFCESWHFPSINIEIIRAWNKTKILILYSYIFEKVWKYHERTSNLLLYYFEIS